VLSGIAYSLVRLIGMTMRFRTEGEEEALALAGSKIICGWHGVSLPASARFRNRGFWVIISLSKDGDIQNHVFRKLGFNSIRGSTGRGGERALVESIRELKKGATMCLTPDGPRGPAGVVQPGILLMAKKSGCALIPIGISAKPCIRFKSWDRYMVPLLFSKATMLYGKPHFVQPDATAEEVEQTRLAVEAEIHDLQARAEAR
jgi:lysophospholipid acyltransferase (LPLAT)-like uncharacterized protein